MTTSICGFCGNEATGFATIGDARFCHGDNDSTPTCYEQMQWKMSGVQPDIIMLQNGEMLVRESEHE